ncbi:putative F-box domain-containing protein [Tanacetum coccineum]
MAEYYIPSEIQVEIMKWLPVKSLMRFKSVSKQWENNHTKLLVSVVVDDDTLPQHKFSVRAPVDHPKLIGSSQGLFCFHGYSVKRNGYGSTKMAFIWNPKIKKSVGIDVPNDALPYSYVTVFGFGVCPYTSDPKLVKIICSRDMWMECKFIPRRVEVFTLSSGVWRSPHSNLPRNSIAFTHNQVVIDDLIYWRAVDMFDDSHLILSFDTITEDFTELYLPDGFRRGGDVFISKLRESLAVLEKSDKSNVRVWMLQNGDPKSFTPLFTIDIPNLSISNVLGFRKSGEPIIVIKNDTELRELYVYDPKSEQISYTGISGEFSSIFATSYMESLLLLDKEDCNINFDIN